MSTLAVNTITNAAGGNTAQINGMTPTAQSLQGFRNRIINGNMVIDQRNAGASVSLVSGGGNTFSADRWYVENATDGTATIQQVSDAPTGFSNSIKYTVTATDASLASDQAAWIQQRIEGFNFSDMLYGTASAQTVTVSFWVKSSVTGTFGVTLANSAYNRGYPASFTVNSANTWEQKTATIAGDTTGTWIGATNGIGVRVSFGIAAGSSRSAASGAWGAGVILGVTGQVNLMATNGATFQVTGVQLEAGSVATPFERRPYGTELQLAQRYFARFNSLGGSYRGVGAGVSESATSISCVVKYPVTMRSGPTASGANMATYDGSSVRAVTAFSTQYTGSDGLNINLTVGGGGMTTNRPANLISDNSGTGYFDLSAEL